MSWSAVRTVAVLELRQRVRSTRWQIMLVVWGVVLVLLCGGMTAQAGTTTHHVEEAIPVLYDMTVCFVLGIGLIIAPTLSATSINGDRADATLALLQATALRSQEIVVGKLIAAWSAAMAFLAVALPFLFVFTLAGGAGDPPTDPRGDPGVRVRDRHGALGRDRPHLGLGRAHISGRRSPRHRHAAGHRDLDDGGSRRAEADHLLHGLRQLDERLEGMRRTREADGRRSAHQSNLVDARPQPLRGTGRLLGAA